MNGTSRSTASQSRGAWLTLAFISSTTRRSCSLAAQAPTSICQSCRVTARPGSGTTFSCMPRMPSAFRKGACGRPC
jgi:hypothetical protein